MGQTNVAMDALNRVLEMDPTNLRALEVKGRIALRIGNRDEAIAAWQEAKKQGGNVAVFDQLIAAAKHAPTTSSRREAQTGPPLPAGHPPIEPEQHVPAMPPGHPSTPAK